MALTCPGGTWRVVDIIYGTGDMTEFLLEYRLEGIMGGDNIPRRPAELIKFMKGE